MTRAPAALALAEVAALPPRAALAPVIATGTGTGTGAGIATGDGTEAGAGRRSAEVGGALAGAAVGHATSTRSTNIVDIDVTAAVAVTDIVTGVGKGFAGTGTGRRRRLDLLGPRGRTDTGGESRAPEAESRNEKGAGAEAGSASRVRGETGRMKPLAGRVHRNVRAIRACRHR